jgi:DNA-binding LacI/PurR family transcriptional regulator
MSIIEVAKKAGVSYATAWRVINGKQNINNETTLAVEKAMQEVGFSVTNRRRLKTAGRKDKQTDIVALLHFRSITTLGNSILYLVQKCLATEGINLVFAHVQSENNIAPVLKNVEVNGILGYGEIPKAWVTEEIKAIPTVWMMSTTSPHPDVFGDRVAPDNYGIGTLAGLWLLEQGCRHVVMMGTDEDFSSYGLGQRWAGFQSAVVGKLDSVQAISAKVDGKAPSQVKSASKNRQMPIIQFGSAQLAGTAEKLVDQWLAMSPRPNGIFVSVDRLLVAINEVLVNRGIKIDADLKIVSCDYEQNFGQRLRVQPCWIDLNREQIAQYAVDRLIWQMSSGRVSSGMLISVFPSIHPPSLSE